MGFKKWDSGRWDGWGIILGFISPFFGDIWSHKTSETLFLVVIFSIWCLLFSQYCLKSKTELPFEKTIPGLLYSKPPRKVSATELELRTTKLEKPKKQPTNLFSNLDFFGPIWGAPPWIFQGFPMEFPRISMDFPPPLLEFSGRPRERPTNL